MTDEPRKTILAASDEIVTVPVTIQVPVGPRGPAGPQGPSGRDGGSAVSSNPFRIDASQPPYNCVSDNGVTDNRPRLQAAVDAAGKLTATTYKKTEVYLPGAPGAYTVYDTVWVDSAGVAIVGDGGGATRIAMQGGHRKSVLMYGWRRTDTVNGIPVQIDAIYRPDCFGKLDVGACPAPGRKWGLATNNDAWAQFQADPIANGPISSKFGNQFADNWAETNQLTWEFVIEPGWGTSWPINRPLMGIGRHGYDPVFAIGTDNINEGQLWVRFKTSEMPLTTDGANTREFRFSVDVPSPWRIAIQFDFISAAISVFVNGKQAALMGQTNLAPTGAWPFVPGMKGFYANECYPYMIGADGVVGSANVGIATTGLKLSLYGLHFSNTIRYQSHGAGSSQLCVDTGAAPDDTYAYFSDDAHTIAYLTLEDDPATLTRNITVQHGQPSGHFVGGGLFMSASMTSSIPGNGLRHIAIQGWGLPYTIPVCLAAVIEFEMEDVESNGGFYGIGSWNTFANWTIHGRNLRLYGSDAAYYCYSQINILRDIDVMKAGRCTFRSCTSMFRLDGAFVAYPDANTESIYKSHSGNYGSTSVLRELMVDFEGPTISGPAIYAENSNVGATSMRLEGLYFGTLGKVPVIQLKDIAPAGGSYEPAFLHAIDINAPAGDHACLVDVDGPLWYGIVQGFCQGRGPAAKLIPLVHQSNKFGLNTGIVVKGAP